MYFVTCLEWPGVVVTVISTALNHVKFCSLNAVYLFVTVFVGFFTSLAEALLSALKLAYFINRMLVQF